MHLPSDSTGATLSTPDSEKQLVAVLLEGHADWLPILCRIIQSPDAFVDPDRRSVWETMLEMHSRKEAISIDTVAVVLRRDKSIPDADRRLLLLIETHAILSLPAAEWHAQQIAYAHARRLMAEAGQLAETADTGPKEMAAALRDKLETMERIAYATGQDAPEPLPLATTQVNRCP